MSTTESGPVRAALQEEGTVLSLVLDRPKGNIITMEMMNALSEVLSTHEEDRGLRLVTLRGAGGNVSYGASVAEHRRDRAPEMLRTFHGLVRQLGSYPVPMALIGEGRCLGGAFELALCCHLVFATEDAVFACPEIKLAVFPPVLAVLGARRLGAPMTERLILTGADLTAREARDVGFVTAVIPTGVDAESAVLDWYRAHLLPLSAFAIRQATRAARRGSGLLDALGTPLDEAERQYISEVLESHDGNEGIEAFIERRSPVWKDE